MKQSHVRIHGQPWCCVQLPGQIAAALHLKAARLNILAICSETPENDQAFAALLRENGYPDAEAVDHPCDRPEPPEFDD